MSAIGLDVPVREAARKLASRRVYRVGRYPDHLFVDSREDFYDDDAFRAAYGDVIFDPTMSERERDRVFYRLCSAPDSLWPRAVAVNEPRAPRRDRVLNVCEW